MMVSKFDNRTSKTSFTTQTIIDKLNWVYPCLVVE